MRSTSSEETLAIGKEIARSLPPNAIVALEGDLGAGKTTLVKGIIHELTGTDPREISSPTFTYMHTYEGVHHFDLYRMKNEQDFLAMGLIDFLGNGICLIEWPERIAALLPEGTIRIVLKHLQETERHIALF